MNGECLVMIGHDYIANLDCAPEPKGVVSAGFEAAAKRYGMRSGIHEFEKDLKDQALKRGANLVSDLTFVSLPVTGGEYSGLCYVMVTGNAYYVEGLGTDDESTAGNDVDF